MPEYPPSSSSTSPEDQEFVDALKKSSPGDGGALTAIGAFVAAAAVAFAIWSFWPSSLQRVFLRVLIVLPLATGVFTYKGLGWLFAPKNSQ